MKSPIRFLIVVDPLSVESALEEVERTGPEVVLVSQPGIDDGIELTREIKARWPTVEVLVFNTCGEEERVLEALRAGASGYLQEGAAPDRNAQAIHEAKSGGTVIDPRLARRLLRPLQVPRPLSDREAEILQLVARGASNNEAAKLLGLSGATGRTHLEHIFQKLEVSNRVEAVTEGLRMGWISA
jgi:DNA-binding NarL/FixJ family response regulator